MSQFTIEAVLKASGGSEFSRVFQEAQQSVKSLEDVGKTLGNVGSTLTKSVTLPLVAMGAGVMAVGKNYEESMSSVQAISGATGADLDKLKNTAREMGATTRYSASESADALGFMALAGWDVEQMTSALPGVLNLATAGNLDLAKASDIVTDTMSMFGLEAQDAGKASDIFAAAQSKSNTNVEQLSEALLNAGPAAAAAGADLEQTSAILGMFANQGVKGGRAGTTLNAMFRDLKAGAEDGAIAIGESQVAVYDANGEMRNMSDIMKDVESATSGLTGEQKDAALAGIFQQQSLTGVNLLLSAGSEELAKLEGELYNSSGTAENMAKIMDDNLGGAMANMKSALEEVALGFFDLAGGPMTTFIQKITELLQWFGKLNGDTKQWILIIAGVAAAIGPVLLVVSKLIGVISGIPAVLGLLAGPVGLVIAGIAAVIAIGVLLIQNWDAIKESSSLLMENLISVFTSIWTGIQGIFDAIAKPLMQWWVDNQNEVKATVSAVWEAIKNTFSVVLEIISSIVQTVFGKIIEYITQNQDAIYGVIDRVWNSIKTAIDFYMNVILPIVEVAWKAIEVVISSAMDIILGIVNTIMGILSGDWSRAWDGVKQVFDGVWDLIVSATTAFMDMLVSTVSNKMEEVKSWASNKLNEMLSIFQNFSLADAGRAIIDGFLGGLRGAWDAGKGFIGGIGGWIKDHKGPISYDKRLLIPAGEAIIGGLTRGLQESFPDVQRTVLGMAGAIENAMTASPTMDISGSIARSNSQVSAAISHELSNSGKQPAYISFKLGERVFNALVEDISNRQGQVVDLYEAF